VALLLPLILIAVAVPHLLDGVANENAFPVPVYTEMNVVLPRASYANAANALAQGMRRNGDRAVAQAEAQANAGAATPVVVATLTSALSQAPASPRGWTLLAEELSRKDRKQAGEALSVALTLAPNDYYLLGRVERDAGYLWDNLSPDARTVASNAAPTLWKFPELRVYIRPVLAMRAGPKLITSGFQYQPEDLRALNRFVTEQRLEEAAQ